MSLDFNSLTQSEKAERIKPYFDDVIDENDYLEEDYKDNLKNITSGLALKIASGTTTNYTLEEKEVMEMFYNYYEEERLNDADYEVTYIFDKCQDILGRNELSESGSDAEEWEMPIQEEKKEENITGATFNDIIKNNKTKTMENDNKNNNKHVKLLEEHNKKKEKINENIMEKKEEIRIDINNKIYDIINLEDRKISDIIEENKESGSVVLNVIDVKNTLYVIDKKAFINFLHYKQSILYPCLLEDSYDSISVRGDIPLYNISHVTSYKLLVPYDNLYPLITIDDKEDNYINLFKTEITYNAVTSLKAFLGGSNLMSDAHCQKDIDKYVYIAKKTNKVVSEKTIQSSTEEKVGGNHTSSGRKAIRSRKSIQCKSKKGTRRTIQGKNKKV